MSWMESAFKAGTTLREKVTGRWVPEDEFEQRRGRAVGEMKIALGLVGVVVLAFVVYAGYGMLKSV